MSKITDENVDAVIKKVRELVDKVLTPKLMEEIAIDVKSRIVKRSKGGKGVGFGGGLESFDELPPLYVEYRKKWEDNLAEFAAPERSNISATGSMLNSIRHQVSGFVVKLFFEDTPRKTLTGKPEKTTNKEVAKALEEKYLDGKKGGRRFFHLSKIDEKAISTLIRNEIRKVIAKK
jgi:hypothetical protein